MVIGIDFEGNKDVLGMCIGEHETSKFWLTVLNELKNRGVEDILICCVDNLICFSVATFFKYPTEIRKLIYTTDIIESYHRQLRMVTKGKSVFSTDESLLKMLYLVTQDIILKWVCMIHNWGQIILQLNVFYHDRIKSFLVQALAQNS